MSAAAGFLTVLLVLSLPGVGSAAVPSSDQRKAIKEAAARGRAIYEQDIAAANATDALLAHLAPARRSELKGWVVTGTKRAPRVLFVGKQGDDFVALFEVVLHAGSAADIIEPVPAPRLEGSALAMFLACQTALAAKPGSCSERYNTIVLPNGRNAWLVYLLAATTKEHEVLVGGHYRAVVSVEGTSLVSIEPLSKSCLTLPTVTETGGPVGGLYMTQVLSDTPSETHVFLSLLHNLTFQVITEPGIWTVAGGRIEYAGPRPGSDE